MLFETNMKIHKREMAVKRFQKKKNANPHRTGPALGSVHYLGTWEGYRIPREGYRIPDTSDGRGREFPTYQMGGLQNSSASREGYRIS